MMSRTTLSALTNLLVVVMCLVTTAVGGLTLIKVISSTGAANASSSAVENVESWKLDMDLPDRGVPGVTAKIGQLALIEFADFECEYCARFANDTLQQIRNRFIDSGKVYYQFMNFPLPKIHPLSARAAAAAVCATEQGKFNKMHNSLFGRKQLLLSADDLLAHARKIGLEMMTFTKCLDTTGPAEVSQDIAAGNRLGVRGTPTFVVGRVQRNNNVRILRTIRGAEPFGTFVLVFTELDASLARRFTLGHLFD